MKRIKTDEDLNSLFESIVNNRNKLLKHNYLNNYSIWRIFKYLTDWVLKRL